MSKNHPSKECFSVPTIAWYPCYKKNKTKNHCPHNNWTDWDLLCSDIVFFGGRGWQRNSLTSLTVLAVNTQAFNWAVTASWVKKNIKINIFPWEEYQTRHWVFNYNSIRFRTNLLSSPLLYLVRGITHTKRLYFWVQCDSRARRGLKVWAEVG